MIEEDEDADNRYLPESNRLDVFIVSHYSLLSLTGKVWGWQVASLLIHTKQSMARNGYNSRGPSASSFIIGKEVMLWVLLSCIFIAIVTIVRQGASTKEVLNILGEDDHDTRTKSSPKGLLRHGDYPQLIPPSSSQQQQQCIRNLTTTCLDRIIASSSLSSPNHSSHVKGGGVVQAELLDGYGNQLFQTMFTMIFADKIGYQAARVSDLTNSGHPFFHESSKVRYTSSSFV